MRTSKPILRALVSVSDKTGIVDFAKKLHDRGVEILSTGGTAKLLVEHLIPVVSISDFTGFPEIMEGRVKTLHPAIFAGILNRPGKDEAVLAAHQFSPIDLVVVNLYPFQKVSQQENASYADKIENIDIGGSSLLRAAAKNHDSVTVICDSKDFDTLITEMDQQNGATLAQTRRQFAQKAFAHSAHYDTAIATFFAQENEDPFPQTLTLSFMKQQDLRYGENPHQQAAFYSAQLFENEQAPLLQGKPLSFNNLVDADTAYQCVQSFTQSACVIVKHANPCGVAQADSALEAYNLAYQTDPVSAFGGVIAFNQCLNANLAHTILNRQFVEVLIAPDIEAQALELLKQKPNIRVLCKPNAPIHNLMDYKFLPGGLLVQNANQLSYDPEKLQVVSQKQPSTEQWQDLLFAWNVVKFVKSNGIVFVKNKMTLGVGAGQMSRIDSTFIATQKAATQNLSLQNAVMASDAFFPFRDNIDTAAKAGISAVIQPGGSIRDAELIAAADEMNMVMVFTNIRHFRH